MLEGIAEIAEDILDAPVRRDGPSEQIGGLADTVRAPEYSTAVGLALYGARHRQKVPFRAPHPFFFTRMGEMFKGWFSELF